MERWSGKVALVTGASEGIGAAIVKALVKHGVQVLGCARNLEKLKELGSSLEGPGSFRPVQCDVTKEDEILKMFEIARQEYRGLHILVNNAGLAHTGYLVESKTEDLREMMEVNVIGKSLLCLFVMHARNKTFVANPEFPLPKVQKIRCRLRRVGCGRAKRVFAPQ